jgi:hypothetical protein
MVVSKITTKARLKSKTTETSNKDTRTIDDPTINQFGPQGKFLLLSQSAKATKQKQKQKPNKHV